jgi:hypothetical protein
VERVGSAIVTEDFPDGRPPAAGVKRPSNLPEGSVFFEPMKGGGADPEIERARFKVRILKGRDDHLQGRVRIVPSQEISEAKVQLHGDQGISTDIEQPTCGCPRPRANLECRRTAAKTLIHIQKLTTGTLLGDIHEQRPFQ